MRAHLNSEMNRLMGMLQSMMADVLQNVDAAMRAIETQDTRLAEQVRTQDTAIDTAEVQIEEECLKILALHQPVADDLRFVFDIARVNRDLERIGDLAAKITRATVNPEHTPQVPLPADLKVLLKQSQKLVHHSLAAFGCRDTEAALAIWDADAEVDRMRDSINHQLAEEMARTPANIPGLLRYRDAVTALERMADHAVNIAKDVIYLVEGRIVRHRGGKAIRKDGLQTLPIAQLHPTGTRGRILFVCVRNSARSQMAAAWANALYGDLFIAESAGLTPGTLNPLAVAVMKEVGIDISHNEPKDVFSVVRKGTLFSYVIIACDEISAEQCPVFVGVTRRISWNVPDPAAFTGTQDEILQKTREVRDTLRSLIDTWVADLTQTRSASSRP